MRELLLIDGLGWVTSKRLGAMGRKGAHGKTEHAGECDAKLFVHTH